MASSSKTEQEHQDLVCSCRRECLRKGTSLGCCPCRTADRLCGKRCCCGGKTVPCSNRLPIGDTDSTASGSSSSSGDFISGTGLSDDDGDILEVYYHDINTSISFTADEWRESEHSEHSILQRKLRDIRKKTKKPAPKRAKGETPVDNQEQGGHAHEDQNPDADLENFLEGSSREDLGQHVRQLLAQLGGNWRQHLHVPVPLQETHGEEGANGARGRHEIADWCHCGHCRDMPSGIENVCCRGRYRGACFSQTDNFRTVCLDNRVLQTAICNRNDILVANAEANNNNFRHTAYRQYILDRYGHVGQGRRIVVPSCCVLAIRARYPSPDGKYTGFVLPHRL